VDVSRDVEVGIGVFEVAIQLGPEVELLKDRSEAVGPPLLTNPRRRVAIENGLDDRLGRVEATASGRDPVGELPDVAVETLPSSENEQCRSVGEFPVVVEPAGVLELLYVFAPNRVRVDVFDRLDDRSTIGVGDVHEHAVDIEYHRFGVHRRSSPTVG
jgi:hypothetical protein